MKPSRLSLISRLCMAVLSLLGFASCDEPMCEYGCPNRDFKITGTVTDVEGTPIEGIRVILPETGYDYELKQSVNDTVFTDAKGQYITNEHNACLIVAGGGIFFDDVDGDAHGGTFASDSIASQDVNNAPSKQYKKGDGNWYEGGFEYTVNKTLKKVKDSSGDK